jgi:hypothetical protein
MIEILAASRSKCAASWLRLLWNATLVNKKRFCPQSLAIFFVLICQRNWATRRVSRISQISLSANVLVRNRQLARDVRVMRETLVLPQLIRRHIFSACEQRQRAPS